MFLKNTGTRYDLGGIIILNILVLIGFGIIYMYFNGFDYSWDEFVNIAVRGSIPIIFSLFFIITGLVSDILVVKEKTASQKQIVVKLVSIERTSKGEYIDVDLDYIYIIVFKDAKNEDYYFQTNDIANLKKEENYDVLVKNKTIISITGKSNISIQMESEVKKESYWLTLYLNNVKYENLVLLPIVYVMVIPVLINLFFSKGLHRIIWLHVGLVGIYIIANDFYQKRKNAKINGELK
jgi:hypothetical protein